MNALPLLKEVSPKHARSGGKKSAKKVAKKPKLRLVKPASKGRKESKRITPLVERKAVAPSTKRKVLMTARAREQLIIEHRDKGRHIAHSLLKRWRSRLDPAEVDSLVDLSICEAAARFDPGVGVTFVTFLFYHLKGNLVRTIIEASRRSYTFVSELEAREGAESWHQKLPDVDAADSMRREEILNPEQLVLEKEFVTLSQEATGILSNIEREVVYRSFVLEEQVTDIADSLGYSRCHVSRIKTRAVKLIERELAKRDGYRLGSSNSLQELRLLRPRKSRRDSTLTPNGIFCSDN